MAFYSWSTTALTNATADATIGWAEGQAPSTVNDSARALMARLAEYRDDASGSLTTGGTSTVYTLTTNQVLAATPANGQLIVFKTHANCGASSTLTCDGGTAYPLQSSPGVAVGSGVLVAGVPYAATYSTSSSAWVLRGYFSSGAVQPLVEYRADVSGSLTTGGTSTVYTLTTNQVLTATPANGQFIVFKPHVNCGASPTLTCDGGTAYPLQSSPGVAVGIGVLVAGVPYAVTYSTSSSAWVLRGYFSLGPIQPPQGYLTPTTSTPVISGDISAATSLYYTPFVGNLVPIYNGATYIPVTFTELMLTLVANHVASAIYDVFVVLNAGSPILVTGPAWTSSTPGSCSRGTGAGTTEVSRGSFGILVNSVAITGRNGASTYSIAANQATYLGSIWIDATAGQLTFHRAWGRSRKWAVWNAYNRQNVFLKAGDSTSNLWNYASTSIRAANGSTANSLTILCGLAEERALVNIDQLISVSSADDGARILIGWNSTTAGSGMPGSLTATPGGATSFSGRAHGIYVNPPFLGLSTVTALEQVITSGTYSFAGGETLMQLYAEWRG